ncbi:RidA family protein [Enterococcus sp. AZ109]|uniref:RidA family protein n=1 Tax=Enterococcus sp. AZ109 TaxID=2774634 RepID=UPI003F279CB7
MKRKNISGNSPWEVTVGYSRAVRVGNLLEIAGTTSVKDGKPYGIGDPYKQTMHILRTVEEILAAEGMSLENVIRTRMFVTDIKYWEAIGKAHGEFFAEIKPAATMVEVSSLIDPDLLVEIEVTAVVE